MPRLRVKHAVLAILVALAVFGSAGCKPDAVVVTSPWPTANAERVVPEPPVPPRWPYTGKEALADEDVTRRPLSVKIENSDAARPQIGLNSADVVYETVVEGGITRFNAIYHSKVPKTLGPVRSARLSDQWIVPQYDALLFFSGRSGSVGAVLAKRDIPVLEHGRVPSAYFRVGNRSAPHNLLLDTKKAFKVADAKGHRMTSEAIPLQFDRRSDSSTPTVDRIDIPFSTSNKVRWEWDADAGVFKRWNDGSVHKDQATGKQLSANNVVVMWADYTEATHDMVGSVTWDIDMGGEGKASVFKNGKRYDGTWKADRKTPPTFTDEEGNPIKLHVGRTWFQVVPEDVKIKVTKPE